MLARPDTKVRGRFCVKRCGPSRRRVRAASAVLKNFVRQPEKTFSTVSAMSGSERTHSTTSAAVARSVVSRSCRAWWCRCVGGGYGLARISAFTYRRRLRESWAHSRRPSRGGHLVRRNRNRRSPLWSLRWSHSGGLLPSHEPESANGYRRPGCRHPSKEPSRKGPTPRLFANP
jgi:hypothetical protein